MKKSCKLFCLSACLAVVFIGFTLLLLTVDVQSVGVLGTKIGFATANTAFHHFTGVHIWLYHVTDWLGLLPILTAFGFALLGLIEWIKRKRLCAVDFTLFALGGLYLVTFAAFFFFEVVIINYRPILIAGNAEASYPSSTTLLVATIMPSACLELWERTKPKYLQYGITLLLIAFTVFMIIARLLSGVHWLSDIIGGLLLSASLVTAYMGVCAIKKE